MPTISKTRSIQNPLREIEDFFQRLMNLVKKHRGKAMTPDTEEGQDINRMYCQLEKALIALVHQQTIQLYHPYVRHYLLSWPAQKDFLRKLHRGLETGISRQLRPCDLTVLVALWQGRRRKKQWSYRRIQLSLERQNLIPPTSPQAFLKRATKLTTHKGGSGPFFNATIFPELKDIPQYVRDFWIKADANLKKIFNSTEARKALEQYIAERNELRMSHFGHKPRTDPLSK